MRIAARHSFPFLALALLGLGACSQPEAPQTTATTPAPVSEPVAPAPELAPAPVPQETIQEGVTFTIGQVTSDCNPETPYRVALSWTIADPARAAVEIHVEAADGPLMALVTSTEYTTESGDWVRQGTRFFLVGRDSREVLATVTAGPEVCQ